MMARDMGWTQQLGDAVLAQRPDVEDAVQRMRHRAYDYGYFGAGPQTPRCQCVLTSKSIPLIQAITSCVLYALVVYARPRPGFFVGGAITFGSGFAIGAAFAPWGWRSPGFGWGAHMYFFDNHPWERGWANRATYVHPYAVPYNRPAYRPGVRYEEHHAAARAEHERHEEHHDQRR